MRMISAARAWELVRTSPLLRDNFVLFAGSMAISGLNYLFYPVVSRFLEPAQFGELQVLLTFFVQVTAIFAVVKLLIIREVANREGEEATRLVYRGRRFALEASAVVLVLGLLAAPIVARELKYDSVVPMYLSLGLIIASLIRIPHDGYLRGRRLFGAASIGEAIGAFLKVALVAMAAALGWGVSGAVMAVAAAIVASYGVSIYFARKNGLPSARSAGIKTGRVLGWGLVRRGLKPVLSIGIASLCITVIVGIDVVSAKYFLTPEQAGLYSGISIIGNILFYLTGSVSGVLLSSVRQKSAAGKNLLALKGSIVLLSSIGLAGVLAFAVFPKLVIAALVGEQYQVYAHLLPVLGLAMFCLSISSLLITYHIALNTSGVGILAVLGLLSVVISIGLSHSTPDSIAKSFCVGNLTMVIMCGLWTFQRLRQPIRR